METETERDGREKCCPDQKTLNGTFLKVMKSNVGYDVFFFVFFLWSGSEIIANKGNTHERSNSKDI